MIKQLKSFTINIVAGANCRAIPTAFIHRIIPHCRSWAWLSLCS